MRYVQGQNKLKIYALIFNINSILILLQFREVAEQELGIQYHQETACIRQQRGCLAVLT